MSEWIPVADRMPTRKDADHDSLVWVTDGSRVWQQQWHLGSAWSVGLGNKPVTHWMGKPKPDPPGKTDA